MASASYRRAARPGPVSSGARDLGFDIIVSAGGEIATGVADYLEYFVSLPETRVIGLVIETIREPERFIAALSEAERRGFRSSACSSASARRARGLPQPIREGWPARARSSMQSRVSTD
ncbi:hypothetical protein HED49_20340 [Ochrobactrum daejeonense]|nr:hypothetical protein [Brucella daejeonensis]